MLFLIYKHIRRIEWALLLALVVSLGTAVFPFVQQCRQISDKVVRLHILANSNTVTDQVLKLQVRDRILQETGEQLRTSVRKEDAEQQIQALLPEIERIAEEELRSRGCTDSVHAELTDMYFTTRTYDSGTLPAGNYRALRITIGAGAGENWWCVMFPPMCLSAAVESSPNTQLEDVLAEDELDIVTHPDSYQIRLKLVEWWTQLVQWFCGM